MNRATEAKTKTEESSVDEKLKLILSEYQTEKNLRTITMEEFLNEKVASRDISSVTPKEDGTFEVEIFLIIYMICI